MATGRVPTTANSPLTAKGDLFTYSTAPARLAVGNNGDTIVADSSTSTGLRYTAGTVQSNPVLNSAFQIWQRGTSIAQAGGFSYSADRWVSARNGFDVGTTMSRQATGDTTNLPFIQYCARVQRNSGTTATTSVFFSQSFENINSTPFIGKTITFSFYARAGANYSSASNALTVKVDTGTGTDQSIINTWTGGASAIGGNQTATLTTTWQRFTYTGTASASGTQLGLYFSYTPVGTAGANDYFEVTGVQIDIGSVALPFRTYAGTIQGELAACQRYYERFLPNTGSGVGYSGIGHYYTTTVCYVVQNWQTKRTIPTITVSGATDFTANSAGANRQSTAVGTDAITLWGMDYTITTAATTLGASAVAGINAVAGWIGVSAEL
jgi:hypothetical protein